MPNQKFINNMRRKYRSFLKPSGSLTDVLSGKDVNQVDPASFAGSRGPGGFTGRGSDGQVQGDKPAGTVHEGEFVVPQGAVNNIGGPQNVEKVINDAQRGVRPTSGSNNNPTQSLNKIGRGPDLLSENTTKPMSSGAEGRKLPGFQSGGAVETLNRAPEVSIPELKPQTETINRATETSIPKLQAPTETVNRTPEVSIPELKPVEEPGIEGLDPLTNITDTVDSNISRLKEFEEGIDIPEVQAPELDPELLEKSERRLELEEQQTGLLDRIDAISRGEDPLFDRLADVQRDRISGQLQTSRGKQAQTASQLGLSGGELNSFFAGIRRDQELTSLGLEQGLAEEQLKRIDAAHGTMKELLNNSITQEDAWTTIRNGMIRDYDQMGLNADIANQTSAMQEQALRSDVINAMNLSEQWGADAAQTVFENWRSEIYSNGQVLLSLESPEGNKAFKSYAERYFPELAASPEVWDTLIENGYAERYFTDIGILQTGLKEIAYTDVIGDYDSETGLLNNGDADYMISAINAWNSKNSLSVNDEGYIRNFNELKANPEAHKWASEQVNTQASKNTFTYAATKEKEPEWALAQFNNIGFVNPDTGELEQVYNTVEDLEEFNYGELTGVEAVKLWWANAMEREAFTAGDDGEINVDWDNELMTVFQNQMPNAVILDDARDEQSIKFSESKGWPEGMGKSLEDKIIVTDKDGKTQSISFGNEIPIGDGLTYKDQNGNEIQLDKEYVTWRQNNPGLNAFSPDTTGATEDTTKDTPPIQEGNTFSSGDKNFSIDKNKIADDPNINQTYDQIKSNNGFTDDQMFEKFPEFFSESLDSTIINGNQYKIDTIKKIDGKTYQQVLDSSGLTPEGMLTDPKWSGFLKEDNTSISKPSSITTLSDINQLLNYNETSGEKTSHQDIINLDLNNLSTMLPVNPTKEEQFLLTEMENKGFVFNANDLTKKEQLEFTNDMVKAYETSPIYYVTDDSGNNIWYRQEIFLDSSLNPNRKSIDGKPYGTQYQIKTNEIGTNKESIASLNESQVDSLKDKGLLDKDDISNIDDSASNVRGLL